MGRKPQKLAEKGSQRWLQTLVNRCPELLNRELAPRLNTAPDAIRWHSPLADDKYAEYWDGDFIKLLGINLERMPLKSFWPPSGPRWDGLGKTSQNQILLMEAKAHTYELNSGSTKSTDPDNLRLIRESLEATKLFIGARSETDWSTCFYQYTNRLAHLYLLREKNKLNAFLVFLYFLNAKEMAATNTIVPETKEEWESAILPLEQRLGIPHRHKLSPYVIDVFINVDDIRAMATPP